MHTRLARRTGKKKAWGNCKACVCTVGRLLAEDFNKCIFFGLRGPEKKRFGLRGPEKKGLTAFSPKYLSYDPTNPLMWVLKRIVSL